MKKTLLLTLAILLSVAVKAQEVLINESFDSAEMPEGWTVMGVALTNWKISNTNMAGGEANEIKLGWNPQFDGITRLVANPLDLTDVKSLKVNLNHYFENYASAISTIGIATSSNNGTSWNVGWSCGYNETGQYSIEQRIATTDMGKDNVLICIFFEGNSARFQGWYFDDFIVTVQPNVEIRLNSIDIFDRIGAGNLNASFTVQNMGVDKIQSFVASYQIEGDEAITETFTASLSSFETQKFSFVTKKAILPGEYNVSFNISEVNETEDDLSDNTLTKTFNVSLSEKQRIPMIEHFSSSTCAPCVLINTLMNKLTEENPGKYTYTKYVVNYPGTGDPYYTEESGIRKDYYEAHSVPRVHIDSELQLKNQTAQPVTQTVLLQRYDTPAFAEIRGAFNIDENNIIHVTADITSYVNLSDVRTFISVNEKTTTENHVEYGGNGEKEWHHVMMKMLPDAEGNITTLKAGEYQRFEFTYDMEATFMEEADDLEVAVWIQNYDTKEIFNSHYLYEYTEHPYPVQNLHFSKGNRLKIKWDAPENGTPTGYNLYINNELVLENTQETSFSIDNIDFCIAEVIALYDNDMTSVGAVNIYSSKYETPQNVTITNDTTKITVTWDAVNGATSYDVYRNDNFIANVETNSYVDSTEFVANKEYCYRIKSVTGNNKSALSEESCTLIAGNNVMLEEYENDINIYPNPANDRLTIATELRVEEIAIYDIYGRLCCRDASNASTSTIDTFNVSVQDLENGIYFINIKTDNGNIVKRFIKN